jgi:general secretion pathway protein E
MGVEPFLLASSLLAVVAQRLLRVLCECKQATSLDIGKLNFDGLPDDHLIFKAKHIFQPNGCELCHGLGYKGRMGIYEIIIFNKELKDMIHEKASEERIRTIAHQYTQSILSDGLDKVAQGLTSLEEVLRVCREN